MKTAIKILLIITVFFFQNGFSQENQKWAEGMIFTETDTIKGLIKLNSISFDGLKFKKNEEDRIEHLTPNLINGFQINNSIYRKVFIKAIGSYGSIKFGNLIEEGKFDLYQTNDHGFLYPYSENKYGIVYILSFNNKTIEFKFNGFYKLKNKKRLARELSGYNNLQRIILNKKFDFNYFHEEIKKLNVE